MQLQKNILILFVFIFMINSSFYAQQIHLKVKASSKDESFYLKQHLTDSVFMNGQDVERSLSQLQERLKNKGFLQHQITSTQKKDSLYIVQFDLGKKTDSIKIHFKEHIELLQKLLNTEQSLQIIPIENTQNHLQNIVEKLAQKGYSISTVKLTNHQFYQNILHTDLNLHLDEKRHIDQLVFTPYNNFPSAIKQRLIKKHEKQSFTEVTISLIQKEMEQFPFIKTEIGRASCRERVKITVGEVALKRKDNRI